MMTIDACGILTAYRGSASCLLLKDLFLNLLWLLNEFITLLRITSNVRPSVGEADRCTDFRLWCTCGICYTYLNSFIL